MGLGFFLYWRYKPLWVCILQPSRGPIAPSRTRFLDHTQRRATVGRAPLDDDQSVAETSTWQHTTLTTDKHPCHGFRIYLSNLYSVI